MEFRQLEYFVTVARSLHFGRAAELLHIGQPAISQQIQRLEKELGVLLFDRSARKVRLTPQGELFLPYAHTVLAAADAAKKSVSPTWQFRIGTSVGLGDRLHSFAKALCEIQQDAEMSFVYYSEKERIELVSAGQLDAIFVRGNNLREKNYPGKNQHDCSELHDELMWEDALMIAMRSGVFPEQRTEIDLEELQNYPLRIVKRELNPTLFDTIMQSCHRAGFEPNIQYYSMGVTDSLVDLTIADPTWTVFYESHARVLLPPGITFYKVIPQITVPTYLLIPRKHMHRDILLQACRLANFTRQ